MAASPTRKRIFDLTGESNYQAALARCRAGEAVTLVPEPNNQFDSNAVYVLTTAGNKIGYLAKSDAAVLQPAVTRQHAAKIHQLTGGMKAYPSIGCRISIAWDGAPEHAHKPLDAQQVADARFSRKGSDKESAGGLFKTLLGMLGGNRK